MTFWRNFDRRKREEKKSYHGNMHMGNTVTWKKWRELTKYPQRIRENARVGMKSNRAGDPIYIYRVRESERELGLGCVIEFLFTGFIDSPIQNQFQIRLIFNEKSITVYIYIYICYGYLFIYYLLMVMLEKLKLLQLFYWPRFNTLDIHFRAKQCY